MSTSKILTIIGLVLNTIVALVLIIPNINPVKNLSDDLVISGNQDTKDYTQVKDLKISCINKIGLILLALGFIFQLVGVLF